MKKVLLTILALVIVIPLSVLPAFGANSKYSIDDMNMTIEVPEDFATLTRDVKETDPNIKIFGYNTAGEVKKMLKSYNAYINTSPKEGGYGILVTMAENKNSKDFFDLNLLNKNEINKLVGSAMKSKIEDIKYKDFEIYQHKQAKFIVFNGKIEDSKATSYVTQYFTIYNGQSININLYSYNEPATKEIKQVHKNIVDSINFTKKINRPFSLLSPTGKTYIDNTIVCAAIVAIIAIIMGITKSKNKNKTRK